MPTYRIKDLRNVDLNLYNFVSSRLNLEGYTVLSGFEYPHALSCVYLIDGYPHDKTNMKLPCVAIEHTGSTDDPLQLGTGIIVNRDFTIQVFARTDGERDDLGEMIKNFLYNSMTIYDYNSVLSSGTYSNIGYADFENIVMYPETDTELGSLEHKMVINFSCVYSVSTGYTLL